MLQEGLHCQAGWVQGEPWGAGGKKEEKVWRYKAPSKAMFCRKQEGFCVFPLWPCTCRVSPPRFMAKGDTGTLAGSGLEGGTEGMRKYLQN